MTLSEILDYLARGWSLIPIDRRGKDVLDPYIPVDETNEGRYGDWKQFTRRRASRELVESWLLRSYAINLAVVTGTISGLLVLDIDYPDAIDPQLTPFLPPDLVIPRVRTARGYHLYFRHPGVRLSNATKPFEWMDIRCDDGYAILPPSTHPNGLAYAWDVPLGDELPDVPADLLSLLVEKCGPYQDEVVHDGGGSDWRYEGEDEEDEFDEDYLSSEGSDDEDFDDEDLFDEDDLDEDEDVPDDEDDDVSDIPL